LSAGPLHLHTEEKQFVQAIICTDEGWYNVNVHVIVGEDTWQYWWTPSLDHCATPEVWHKDRGMGAAMQVPQQDCSECVEDSNIDRNIPAMTGAPLWRLL